MTCCEALYSDVEAIARLAIPNPPSRQGNANRFPSRSFGGGLPVRVGMKEQRMASSRG